MGPMRFLRPLDQIAFATYLWGIVVAAPFAHLAARLWLGRLPFAFPLGRKSMNARVVVVAATLASLLCLTDSASALGRRWERRRAELYGSLNTSLSASVAAQSAASEQRLSDANKAQIASISDKLNSDLNSALAQLRQQAGEAVAAEAKRLQEETKAQFAALRESAQQELTSELTKAREEAKQAVVTEFNRTREDLTRQVAAEAQKAKDTLMPELKNAVAAEVKTALASAQPAQEQPAEKKPEQPADKPTVETPKLQTEKKEGGE